MSDEEPSPSETPISDALLTKIIKSGALERIVTIIVSAALGVFGGGMSHSVKEANETKTIQENKLGIQDVQQAIKDERAARQAEIDQRKAQRDSQIRSIEDRLLILETKLQHEGVPRRRPVAEKAAADCWALPDGGWGCFP